MGKLDGKTALITGGTSGIGLATAKQFVTEGAYVVITGRRDSELTAAVKEIGRQVSGVQGDVSNLADLDRVFAEIKRERARLEIVFANAGVARYAPFGTITEELYDSIFDINVKGLLFTVQKALPLMPDGASVILNASIVASKGLPAPGAAVRFATGDSGGGGAPWCRQISLAAVGRLLLTDCCGRDARSTVVETPQKGDPSSQPLGIGGMSDEIFVLGIGSGRRLDTASIYRQCDTDHVRRKSQRCE
jgi:short chain dehydrogenase